MGRNTNWDIKKKENRISIRADEELYKVLCEMAEINELPLSDYIRLKLMEGLNIPQKKLKTSKD
ncbi:MAG: hypothetical protein FWG20_05045 [Candidatus Cloacimonetes bacterium]|nr:hypothetical protein [Candidatus Cloacimonadota bacterium]